MNVQNISIWWAASHPMISAFLSFSQGGACTSAILQTLYADHSDSAEDLTFEQVILKIRDNLSENFSQIPQLSSSKPLNIKDKFNIAPEGSEGIQRAVMVGINYTGQDGALTGCHNDIKNVSLVLWKIMPGLAVDALLLTVLVIFLRDRWLNTFKTCTDSRKKISQSSWMMASTQNQTKKIFSPLTRSLRARVKKAMLPFVILPVR